MLTKFEVGTTYFMRSICDSECIWTFTVTKRTDKSIWIKAPAPAIDPPQRRRISVYRDVEQISPFGRYSMSPILGADRPVVEEQPTEAITANNFTNGQPETIQVDLKKPIGTFTSNWRLRHVLIYDHPTNPDLVLTIGKGFKGGSDCTVIEPRAHVEADIGRFNYVYD